MATERLQRRIERLLDQVEEATDQQDWDTVLRLARQVLSIDPDNADAAVFLKIAELESGEAAATSPQTSPVDIATEDTTPAETAPAYAPPAEVDSPDTTRATAPTPSGDPPVSFAGGRYMVKNPGRRRQETGLPGPRRAAGQRRRIRAHKDRWARRYIPHTRIPRGPGDGTPRNPSAYRHSV